VQGSDAFTGLMVTTRENIPGDEITYDYCTTEDCELSPSRDCHCRQPNCRRTVTPQDWKQPELQARYASHFLPHIAAKIEIGVAAASTVAAESARHHSASTSTSTLEEVDASSFWWIAHLENASPMPALAAAIARPDRHEVMRRAATGVRLDTLNRQAAMLIMHYGLMVLHNGLLGGYVVTAAPIAAGELVMLLPPNLLLWEDEVRDFNTCLQVGITSHGDRVFSSSLTPHDIDNFLCHSCEPNCCFHIGEDLTAGLVALRSIEEGEAIHFDYDATEDNLRGECGGFECHCGAPSCRGHIFGRKHSPMSAPVRR